MFRAIIALVLGAFLAGPATRAEAGVVIYSMDLAGFLIGSAGPLEVIDFDDIAPGTNISGAVIQGVRFVAPGAPLLIVQGNSTETTDGFIYGGDTSQNKLFPTSGENVLSPGGTQLVPGPNPTVENDSLSLELLQPLAAFGIDLLWQQADGQSYTHVHVYDPAGTLLYSALLNSLELANGSGWSGGADFFGIIATGGDRIGRIDFLESDDDMRYTDSNIGYDTIFYQTATPTPEPASMALIGGGLLALGLVRRRKREE
jgi:hypothetical protein